MHCGIVVVEDFSVESLLTPVFSAKNDFQFFLITYYQTETNQRIQVKEHECYPSRNA
jgi:hypothetical protein